MFKRAWLALVLTLSVATGGVSGQNLQWAINMGSDSYEEGKAVTSDQGGNVFVTGGFQDTADFDPGPAQMNLVSNGGYSDIFLAKYDNSGNYLWALGIGGMFDDKGYSIGVDGNGNVYITGSFSGTADFDPGPGTAALTSNGSTDIFLAKYDTNGNYLWAISIGSGAGADIGYGLVVDLTGGVYLTGVFFGSCDFDPGANAANLVSNGANDIFLAKYSTNGDYLWAHSMGGFSFDNSFSAALDATGEVIVTGSFMGSVDFDPSAATNSLVSSGSNDIFAAKYTSAGAFVWARSMGGTSNDQGLNVATDVNGNVLITGIFRGTADFDPGPGATIINSAGAADIFLVKLDVNGVFQWVRTFGSSLHDQGNSIAVNQVGEVYSAGYFQGIVDFDAGSGVADLVSAGGEDIYVCKYDASGNYQWAYNIGASSGSDMANGVHVEQSGTFYLTGYFSSGTCDFDFGSSVVNINNHGWNDIYIGKYGYFPLAIKLISFNGVQLGDANELWWETEGDGQEYALLLQRSADGLNFESIDTIDLRSGNNEYFTTDKKPLAGNNYYRLMFFQADGIIWYSKVIKISFQDEQAMTLTAFPNPFREFIELDNNTGHCTEIVVIHLAGTQVWSTEVKEGRTTLHLGMLPPGMYILREKFSSQSKAFRIIKQ